MFFFAIIKGNKLNNNLLVNQENGILDVTFNRPETKNAINRKMFHDLYDILNEKLKDSSTKGIFISGNGDAFSSGGDVKDMASNKDNFTLEEKTSSLRRLMKLSKLLYNSHVPTVAVITGAAAGAGFALALACDFRIANENAKFTTAFTKVGFSGDFGAAYFLSKIVGISKAKELFYFSEILSADEATSLGIVNYLKRDADLNSYVEKIKDKIRELPPIAIKYVKKNLNNSELNNLDHYLNEEALYQMICSETNDHKNAVKAFINKEKPVFKGN